MEHESPAVPDELKSASASGEDGAAKVNTEHAGNGAATADNNTSDTIEVPQDPGSPQQPPTNRAVMGTYPVPMAQYEALGTYVQRARNISIFSIAFTVVCAGVGIGFSFSTNSSALLAYGLEALVDVWSSVLVLWRFWSDPGGEGQYFITTRRRESRASVGIAFTFVAIYVVTASQAIVHLVQATKPEKSDVLLAIAGTSVIILSWSSAVKYSLSKVLHSNALRKDAITSGACAIMAATMLVSTTVYKNHPSVWWLDAAVALVIAAVLGLIGVRTLVHHQWWKREFWVDGELPPEERGADKIMKLRRPHRHSHDHSVDAAEAQRVEQELVRMREQEEAAAAAKARALEEGDLSTQAVVKSEAHTAHRPANGHDRPAS